MKLIVSTSRNKLLVWCYRRRTGKAHDVGSPGVYCLAHRPEMLETEHVVSCLR